jgi:hypothetical protein
MLKWKGCYEKIFACFMELSSNLAERSRKKPSGTGIFCPLQTHVVRKRSVSAIEIGIKGGLDSCSAG